MNSLRGFHASCILRGGLPWMGPRADVRDVTERNSFGKFSQTAEKRVGQRFIHKELNWRLSAHLFVRKTWNVCTKAKGFLWTMLSPSEWTSIILMGPNLKIIIKKQTKNTEGPGNLDDRHVFWLCHLERNSWWILIKILDSVERSPTFLFYESTLPLHCHVSVQIKHKIKHEVCSATTWTPPEQSTRRELSFEWSHPLGFVGQFRS